MRLRWPGAVVLLGLVGVIAGYAWNAVDSAPDANIGAGLLVLLGWALLAVGLVLWVVMLVVARRRQSVSSGGVRR